jgi:4'-phosphopantetheinyl transferase EntD
VSVDPRLARLVGRAAALFPPSVAVAGAGPCDPATLHPAERAAIARAVLSRQREFAGGRAAARMAQRQLGLVPRPVPMGPDRAPLWPPGLCGAITHAEGLCLAALTADPLVAAIGLDLEADAPLPPDVASEVLGPAEGQLPGRLVFSAKETVFKALHATVGATFGFDAVRIALHEARFTAETLVALGPIPAGTRLSGRFWRGEGLILTALVFEPARRGPDVAAP